jgi:hypothetical protein
MFALSTLIEAVPAPVPSFALWLHPTPFAWAGLIALAFALGAGLATLMRAQGRPFSRVPGMGASARPAGA